MMAKVRVKYVCGCGFKTNSLEEAVKHSDLKSHTLDAIGQVVADKKKSPLEED